MALVLTIDGNNRTAVLKEESLRIEQLANTRISVASLTIIDADSDITITPKDTISVVDGATTYFAGTVAVVERETKLGTYRLLYLTCQDYNILLNTVVDAEEVFTAEADADIIDNLFDDYLPAIDSETHVATVQDPMTITFENKTLRECLNEICTRSGATYYVGFDMKLHYFSITETVGVGWFLSDDPAPPASYGYNIEAIEREDGATLINRVRVVGDDIAGWVEDFGSQVTYGIWEYISRDNRITTSAGITNRGNGILARYKDPTETFVLVTSKSGLVAGNDIRVVNAIFGMDATYTIRKLVVKFQPDMTPRFHLHFGDFEFTGIESYITLIDAVDYNKDPVSPGRLPLSSRGWAHDLVFSATDHNTVAWAAGSTITVADGTEFAIDAGNTGDMGAIDIYFVYLDRDTSETVLQTTTDVTVAVGTDKLLIAACYAVAAGKDAVFQVFGGEGIGVMINADNIVANCITTNEIAANTITAGNIAAGAIETDELAAGAVTAVKIAAATITADKLAIGSMMFNDAAGLLLLNDYCPIAATTWETLRKQLATLSGAFHQVGGRWLGTRALLAEVGTQNLCDNPSIEVDTTDWTAMGGVISQSATYAKFGDYSLKEIPTAAVWDGAKWGTLAMTNGETYIASVWFKGGTPGASYFMGLRDIDDASYVGNYTVFTATGDWQRVVAVAGAAVGNNDAEIWVRKNNHASVAPFYVDGVQIENLPAATSYCDGSLGTGYAWDNGDHASTSTRTKTEANLDAHTNLVSNHATLSFRVVVQIPYDDDADWAGGASGNFLFDLMGADNNNRIFVQYSETDDLWKVYINGGYRLTSLYGMDAGDWIDIVVTLDFTNDEYYLYLDGKLADSDTTALAAPILTQWSLGASYLNTVQGGFAISEFAVFDDVLTAIEAAQLFNLQRPLVDGGATETPGIYIVDGKFRIASSLTGNRIEIDADEIAGYDSGGTKQFYLVSSDGMGYFGGGLCRLEADGLVMIEDDAVNSHIQWKKATFGGQSLGVIYDDWGGGAGDHNVLWIVAHEPVGGADGRIMLRAEPTAGAAASITIDSVGSITTENASFHVIGKLSTTTHLETAGGTEWNFGGVVAAGPPAADRKIHVEIDGNWYTIHATNGLV